MKRASMMRSAVLWSFLLLILVGAVWTPHPPGAQLFRENALAGPSADHWLGIDPLGRDFFSRLWRGASHTVWMALGAALGAVAISGLLLWMDVAGGRLASRAMSAVINLWLAVPVVFVGLLLLVALRPSPSVLVLAAALGNVPLSFRQLRVLWREQVNALHVESSRVLGATGWRLLRVAIWPNLRPDLMALGKLVFAVAALELSGLAFLGLIGDPDFPELGALLKQHQADLYRAPWLVIWPGAVLSALLLLIHLSRGERAR